MDFDSSSDAIMPLTGPSLLLFAAFEWIAAESFWAGVRFLQLDGVRGFFSETRQALTHCGHFQPGKITVMLRSKRTRSLPQISVLQCITEKAQQPWFSYEGIS
jgi:hypothetical protein